MSRQATILGSNGWDTVSVTETDIVSERQIEEGWEGNSVTKSFKIFFNAEVEVRVNDSVTTITYFAGDSWVQPIGGDFIESYKILTTNAEFRWEASY